MSKEALFQPIELGGGLRLPNRIVMAPCTRNRATAQLGPSEGAAAHYASRADAGLQITEAVMISPEVQGYHQTPGIYLDVQVRGWAAVCDAVHRSGGRIFAQLWHTGRVAHSQWTHQPPLAPSAVLDPVLRRQTGGFEIYNEMPRALQSHEVLGIVEQFRQAARRALEAGFDGVEVHGANGYLLEQFLRAHTNRRDDEWGGSLARRVRFGVQVMQACVEVWGPHRVGLRLSPAAYFSEMRWTEGDNEAYMLLLEKVHAMQLAYLHTGVVEDRHYDELGGNSTQFLRRHWPGVLIANGAYLPEDAARHIAQGDFDMVSFGRRFIANPDLVTRLRSGQPLRAYHSMQTRGFR